MSSRELTFPLIPRRRVAGAPFGAMRTRRRGAGIDLAGARPYRSGDDVRRIDWRASARLSSLRDVDELVVREHLTEAASQVAVVVDGSPSMRLFPDGYPWLSKPAAIAEVTKLIRASAACTGCPVGLLDDADVPGAERNARRAEPGGTPGTPPRSLARSVLHLTSLERALPEGTFVFLLSDFLDVPQEEVWLAALDRGWDLVPVVIQDPTWEQSFPDIAGALVPLADPSTGRARNVRLSRAEVNARRAANEARFAGILDRFDLLGLDAAVVTSSDPGRVLAAFLDWSSDRYQGSRLAR